jgi:RNA polymerase sigma-70 factor (ECF subfamily)
VEPLDLLPDAALVEQVGARRPDAVEELWKRHAPAVLGVARRVTGVAAHAEEVLQEVFLRLWRAPERFDPSRGALRSYLLMEANARAIELVRRDAARRGREDRTLRVPVAAPVEVEDEVWDVVLAEHLRDALDALSDEERESIELAYYGGHSYRDVAAILGLPEGTVKSRIRTGLLRLRDRLEAVDLGGGR